MALTIIRGYGSADRITDLVAAESEVEWHAQAVLSLCVAAAALWGQGLG